MPHEIAPISVRPWTLHGISKRTIVSHYSEPGRTLNAVRADCAALDARAPACPLRSLKRLQSMREARVLETP
jgi:hypothetical protein